MCQIKVFLVKTRFFFFFSSLMSYSSVAWFYLVCQSRFSRLLTSRVTAVKKRSTKKKRKKNKRDENEAKEKKKLQDFELKL